MKSSKHLLSVFFLSVIAGACNGETVSTSSESVMAPRISSITFDGATSVTGTPYYADLNWAASTSESAIGYIVFDNASGSLDYVTTVLSPTATSVRVPNLVPGSSHKYVVRVLDKEGTSDRNTVAVTYDAPAINSAYTAAVLADNPVGYWRLNDTFGETVADSSGTQAQGIYGASAIFMNPGPLLNDPGTLSTHSPKAFILYNLAKPGPTQATNISLEIWLKPLTGAGSGDAIYVSSGDSKGYGLNLSGQSVNVFIQGVTGTALNSSYTLPLNTWSHTVLTRSGGGAWKLYVNGVDTLRSGSASPGSMSATANTVICYPNNYLCAEAAVYNTELSLAQIQAHYHAGGYP